MYPESATGPLVVCQNISSEFYIAIEVHFNIDYIKIDKTKKILNLDLIQL
jgi:hypothetical protein